MLSKFTEEEAVYMLAQSKLLDTGMLDVVSMESNSSAANKL